MLHFSRLFCLCLWFIIASPLPLAGAQENTVSAESTVKTDAADSHDLSTPSTQEMEKNPTPAEPNTANNEQNGNAVTQSGTSTGGDASAPSAETINSETAPTTPPPSAQAESQAQVLEVGQADSENPEGENISPSAEEKGEEPLEYLPFYDPATPMLPEQETVYLDFTQEVERKHEYLRRGWREPTLNRLVYDAKGLWATSMIAELNVTVLRPREMELTLLMIPLLTTETAQRVRVYWNDRYIGTCAFVLEEAWNQKRFVLRVPQEYQKFGKNIIRFESLYAQSPTQARISQDNRVRAFQLCRLGLYDPGRTPQPTSGVQYRGETLLQSPDTLIYFPVQLPKGRACRFEMGVPQTDAASPRWRVLLRVESADGTVLEQPILTEASPISDGHLSFSLAPYQGALVEFVFDATPNERDVVWVAPRIWGLTPHRLPNEDTHVCSVPQKKHVVLVVCDALRANSVGVYGAWRDTTPTLDHLAQEGYRVPYVYTVAPYTYSASWSLLTGLLPFQHRASDSPLAPAENVSRLQGVLKDAGIYTGCISALKWVSPLYGIAKGFDTFVDAVEKPEVLQTAAQPQQVTLPALSFLRENRGKPFFLYLHYRLPHEPYFPPESVRGTFVYPHRGLIVPNEKFMSDIKTGVRKLNEEERNQLLALYEENVKAVDAEISTLVDELENLGIAEDTWLIITADHGEAFFEHGMQGHGQTGLYEEVTRIPLILWSKNTEQNAYPLTRQWASTVDIFPTVCAMLGVAAPKGLAGTCLWGPPPSSPWHVLSFAQCAWQIEDSHLWDPAEAFWFEGYKLIRQRVGGYLQVYDRTRDPEECNNLAVTRPILTHYLSACARIWRIVEERKVTAEPVMQKIENTTEQIETLRSLGYL